MPKTDIVISRFTRTVCGNQLDFDRAILRMRAFGDASVAVNGVGVTPALAGETWKRSSSYAIGSQLVGGCNVIRVDVRNARGVPLLLVEDPPELRTPDEWSVSAGALPGSGTGAVAALFRPPRPGPLQRSPAWRWLEPLTGLWVAGWSAAAALAITRGRTKGFERSLPLAFVVAGFALNVSNAAHHPNARVAYDAAGHERYVAGVSRSWRPPLASDGWQMYHPPLFYFTAALVAQRYGAVGSERWARSIRYVGASAGSLLAALAWAYLRLLRPADVRGTWIATAVAAFLPVVLYAAPLASNEAFAAAATGAAVYALLVASVRRRPSVGRAFVAGIATGAALLAKASALIALGSGVLAFLIRAVWRRTSRELAAFIGAASMVAGWFYARNLVVFRNPLVANWQAASGFAFHQEPTFRTAGFFLDSPLRILAQHPTRAIWSSFVGGHYATTWSDAHSTLFAQSDERAFAIMSILMLLGIAPSIVTALGLVLTVSRALRTPRNVAALLVVAVVVLGGWVVLVLALQAPHYSSIKASYWLALVPSLAVCFATGRARIGETARAAGWLLDADCIACVGLAWWLFRA